MNSADCANAMMLPLFIVAIFYFLVWRPQQKQTMEAQRFRDGLKVDDRIVTAGGIYGRVARLEPDAIELEIAPKVKIRVARSQIVSTQKTGSEDKKETK